MYTYRSRPTLIDAEQWFPNKQIEGVKLDNSGHYVVTIHDQKVYLSEGDYVIKEPDGIHYYPCKPDIFEKKYELVGKKYEGRND
jgi:hypothetical protein